MIGVSQFKPSGTLSELKLSLILDKDALRAGHMRKISTI